MEERKLVTRMVGGVPVTEGSGNVFADLGRPNAELLLQKAERIWLLKGAVRERRWSRKRAAEVIGEEWDRLTDINSDITPEALDRAIAAVEFRGAPTKVAEASA